MSKILIFYSKPVQTLGSDSVTTVETPGDLIGNSEEWKIKLCLIFIIILVNGCSSANSDGFK